MRCTNNRKRSLLALGLVLFISVSLIGCGGKEKHPTYARTFEKETYNNDLYREPLFADELCVSADNVALNNFSEAYSVHASGLFDINNKNVLYADRIHERLFPASTTKILTAYVAMKYGNLEDQVTISETATTFEPDASLCGLQVGDTLSLYDLICGLTLASGNDAGVAIAEHISGSVEAFADLMNQEALALGATNTHFVNPHGLHEEDHYTTAYDLYLMFYAAIQNKTYVDILSMKSYQPAITCADGTVRNPEWEATNFYSAEVVDVPEGVRVIGGKTGTTDQAGNCVVLYDEDLSGNPYISIIMGAEDKPKLYEDMSQLMTAGISKK